MKEGRTEETKREKGKKIKGNEREIKRDREISDEEMEKEN